MDSRPSSTWRDVKDALDELIEEEQHRIISLVSSIDFDQICSYATSLHGHPCAVNREKYTWGQTFVVFEILFGDGTSWIIRLKMQDPTGTPLLRSRAKIETEVATLRLVHEKTSIPAPRVIAFASASDERNPFGKNMPPFILMTSIVGYNIADLGVNLLGGPVLTDESKRPIAENFMADLATMHLELSKIRFPMLCSPYIDVDGNMSVGPNADKGSGPFHSAYEFFADDADELDKRAVSRSDDSPVEQEQRIFISRLYREAVKRVIYPLDALGPFPLSHGDLHIDNVVVNTEGRIAGVLDWDCAAFVPFERFGVPSFQLSDLFYNSFQSGPTVPQNMEKHRMFNRALRAKESAFYAVSDLPSRRTFSDLHDSLAGQVASFLAYFLHTMDCDYKHIGRSLCGSFSREQDIDSIFRTFTEAKASGQEQSDVICGLLGHVASGK